MLDVYNGTVTFEDLSKELLDSLTKSLNVMDTKEPFTTTLPFGVTISGRYNLSDRFSLGLLSHSRIIGKQIKEALTLSANLNIGNTLSTSLSYTASNNRYDNLGLGLAFRAGVFQFYLVADKIPIMWNKIIIKDGKYPMPVNWNTIQTWFGMNLVFGNRIRKVQDKPMVLVE